ncbi:MAG: CDP-alcohol phosphatidyltransferase family protein [Phycisphaerales bacterium JB040]
MSEKAPTTRPARPGRWKKRLPNLLTLLRIVLAAVFVAIVSRVSVSATEDADPLRHLELLLDDAVPLLIVAAAVFVVASLTDALDGILARKWKAVTRFGRVMDPVADKLLILGAFLMLAGPNFSATWVVADGQLSRPIQLTGVSAWMVWVILGRELLVTSIRGVYEAEGVDFSASLPGKVKMIVQSVAVPLILLVVAFGNPGPDSWGRTLVIWTAWVTVAVTVWSGLPYIARAMVASQQLGARPRLNTRGRPAGPRHDRVEIPATRTRRAGGRKERKKKSR